MRHDPANPLRRGRRALAAATLFPLCLLAACGGGGGSGDDGGDPPPPPPTPASLPPTSTPIVHDTTAVALNATRETLAGETEPVLSDPEDVVYPYDPADPEATSPVATTVKMRSQCLTRTYDITSNPEKVALYAADGNVSYPGALLRGDQFRAGQLRRLGVRPEHRAPVTFVINNVFSQTGNASGTVNQPDLQPVQDAVKARIVAAFNDDIPIGDSVAYRYEETSDITRFMLKGRVSARYGGISGALGTRVDKRQSERSIVVSLVQKLYDVEVQQPPTKDDWFNAQFFASGLKPLLDSGEVSAANPPVYVSRVTYGRVLTFAMTSTASRSDLETLLRAKVRTLVAGGSLALDTRQTRINQSKRVTLAQIGGNGGTALSAAQSGDWGLFFKQDLKLTQAVPIEVEYRNLYDNSPAGVTENTRVTEEVCTPQLVVPGPFDFALADTHERPAGIDAIQQVAVADIDGDGLSDVIWNRLISGTNRLYVGYGSPGGRLRIDARPCGGAACDFSDAATPWGQYRLRSGDFNGDGRADLAWLRVGASHDTVELRVLLAAPGGGFETTLQAYAEPLTALEQASVRADPVIADLNNDGRSDLALWFVRRSGEQNQVFARIWRNTTATAGGGMVLQPQAQIGGFTDRLQTNPATARFTLSARDIDSDGWNDLLLELLGQGLNYAGTTPRDQRAVAAQRLNNRVADDIGFAVEQTFIHSAGPGWLQYASLAGDFDGDGDVDLAWLATDANSRGRVHQAAYNGSGQRFDQLASQDWLVGSNGTAGGVLELLQGNDRRFVGETNGDAAADVIVNAYLAVAGQPNAANAVAVMKGVASGSPMFNVSTPVQRHPVNRDWQNFAHVFVGDFNGDGLQDILWNNAALDNVVYIGFAKREQDQAAF